MESILDTLSNSKKNENKNEYPQIGIAVAALVFGILSLTMAIFLMGVIWGVVGIILGGICLAKKCAGKKIAGCGIGLSIVGILASCIFALAYYGAYNIGKDFRAGRPSLFEKWIGQSAPDFTVKDVKGNTIKLMDLKGKQVVLNFWDPSLLRCRDVIPSLIKLRNNVPEDKLIIIGISRAEAEEVRDLGARMGINYPLVSTEQLSLPYNIYWGLNTFFIDKNGVIVDVLREYHSFDKLSSLVLRPDNKIRSEQEKQVIQSEKIED